MKPYPKYKSSGVPWLGAVPEHWEDKKLKHVSTCLDGMRTPLNATERGERQGTVPYWGANTVVDWVKECLLDEPLVLLGEDGAPFFDKYRPVAFAVDGPIWPNNHIHVLRPEHGVSTSFLAYYLNCVEYVFFVEGSTRDKLTQTQMARIPVYPPPPAEQSAITAYLDTETSRIDTLVAEKGRLIGLLHEYRQSVITEAVTKGLNPDATMQDSGVPWLGDVPEDWNIERLKFGLSLIESGTSVNSADVPAAEGQLGVLKTSCVYTRTFRSEENKTVVPEDESRVSCPVRLDSVIVSRMNTPELVGAAGLVRDAPENIFLPDRLWQVIADQEKLLPAYLYWFTNTQAYSVQVQSACSGSSESMQNLGQDKFRNFSIPLPLPNEQTAIAAYLDTQTAKIDGLIAHVEREIELLKELRSATITDAVLGRIDLRDYTKKNKRGDKASELQPAL